MTSMFCCCTIGNHKPLLTLSDVDTRRRAACDLVRALSKSFEGPVIQNFSTYVQAMLQVGQSITVENGRFIVTWSC